MFKKKSNYWTYDDFLKYINCVDSITLQKEVQEIVMTDNKGITVNETYPMYKQIGGVSIEIGIMTLYLTNLEYILRLLNNFIMIQKKKEAEIIPKQNFSALVEWSNDYNLEIPDIDCCKGYLLNNELVNFGEINNTSVLQFKYKDSLHNTFSLYHISFIRTKDDYYILLRKSY